jgi:hypothetical protein
MEIFKSVTKKSLIVLIPVLIAALFIESRKMPLGIFFGWLFGVINFKGMTKNIEAMTDVHKAKLKIFILSITRLAFLFAAIFAMAYYKLVNIIGLLIGFTIVFIFILVDKASPNRQLKINNKGLTPNE